jgi:glycosyltransferase involved in cell wall biosynthesis
MISYLLATNRDLNIATECLRSIEALAPHEHEIIICAPQHIIDQVEELTDPAIKFIVDDINDGSTYAFNKGFEHCSGEWIITAIDDNVLSVDINRLLFLLSQPEVQQAEYQVYNLGGQWYDTMRRNHNNEGLPGAIWSSNWTVGVTDETFDYSYPVISLPVMSRRTVLEKFGGMYFNPMLIHHYVDHWLGAYVHKKVPHHNPNIYSPQSCWTQQWHGEGNCIRKYDEGDGATYVRLLKHLIQEDPNCRYGVVL